MEVDAALLGDVFLSDCLYRELEEKEEPVRWASRTVRPLKLNPEIVFQ